MGKVVISNGAAEDVRVSVRRASPSLGFHADAAYLIVGGLKGLCGSLATYMARCGAKNLVIVSRSGAEDDASRRIIEDLSCLGTNTTVLKADVSLREDVDRVFRESPLPIQGIIQGAMVLRDKTLESMALDEYRQALACKVAGTRNLHNAAAEKKTGNKLEFFTLLSSISGIVGTAGQTNYAAGNSFQDAFALYRHSLGLAANAIDLGIVEDVGYMSEHQSLTDRVKSRSGLVGIGEKQLHDILKFSILQQSQKPSDSHGPTQMITGLPFPLPEDSPLLAGDIRFRSLLVARRSGSVDKGIGKDENDSLRDFQALAKSAHSREKLISAALKLANIQIVKALAYQRI